MAPDWICKPWAALERDELYRILAARVRVFVVEQRCPYQELDGLDAPAWHLWTERGGQLAAYLRIHPPGAKYAEASLGRIITAPEARGAGLGRAVVAEGLRRLAALCGAVPVRIGAQAYLERFYGDFGFARDGADYDEDGIPHLEMVRPAPRATSTW